LGTSQQPPGSALNLSMATAAIPPAALQTLARVMPDQQGPSNTSAGSESDFATLFANRREEQVDITRDPVAAVQRAAQAAWGSNPVVARQRIQVAAVEAYFRGKAQATWDAQASAVRSYRFFASSLRYDAFPATEDTLIAFAVWSAARVSVTSVRKYVGHVRAYHKTLMLPIGEASDMPRLQQVLEGLERAQTHSKDRRLRLPLTHDILSQMQAAKHAETAATAGHDVYSMANPTMSDAVYAVAFLGSLRPGEIGQSDHRSPPLQLKDWTVHTPSTATGIQFGTLHLAHRKNQQLGEHCDVVIGVTNSAICAVTAMEKYLKTRREAGEVLTELSLLFPTRMRDGSFRALSYELLTASLDKDLQRAGFPADQYNGHSFRIGAATSMGLHGVPDYWIEDLGSWAPGSKSMRGYLHLSPPEARARMTAFLTRPYTSDKPSVYGPWRMANTTVQQPMVGAAPEPSEPVASRPQVSG
jgi:hypothetical protein